MIEIKKRNWWDIGVLIFIATALIWALLGVFSMLLGYSTAYAYEWTQVEWEITSDGIMTLPSSLCDGVPVGEGNVGSYFNGEMPLEGTSIYGANGYCFVLIGSPFNDMDYLNTNGDGIYYHYFFAPNNHSLKNFYSRYTKTDGVWNLTPYPTLRVWGIDPVSETEITDLDTNFEFGWEGLDDWDSLWVNFQNRPTGIFTEGQEILITTTPSGSAVFNLTDFNFDRYGTFYFHAVAGREVPEVIEGMFFTGKYTSEWTGDLVSPDYNLILTTTTGLAPVFEMSDFEEWYGANAKFDEPTDMFSAIAGFFDPIFNKIGEFGDRIADYFNVNEAYSQGYEIGKAVPYFTYFVGQVSLFLGGFPIMKWLFVIVLLLTGIFIFRLIMKFIPFLGN